MKIETSNKLLIGMLGAIICFVSDMMLGFYTPEKNKGILAFFPNFSKEWANVNKNIFVIAGAIGVVAILMFMVGLYGIYELLKKNNIKHNKIFLVGTILFITSAGLYHNVFAITAYVYNTLAKSNPDAFEIACGIFKAFIPVAGLAALGFAMLSIYLLVATLFLGFSKKWEVVINPLLIMIVFVILSIVLPLNKYVNGIINMGQQSISLVLFFLYFMIKEIRSTQ